MTAIKICGLTREEDVRAAVAMGADMLGFIHVPRSSRFVPEDRLAALLAAAGTVKTVVVVQNESPQQLTHLRHSFQFHSFQFHGDEPHHYCSRFGGYPVVHVVAGQAPAIPKSELFLLDTAVGGQRGGSGKTFDWSLLDQVEGNYLVAGGLKPDNVGELVGRYQPWGIDVSSGIEAEPGIKDHHQMLCFFENARKEGTHE